MGMLLRLLEGDRYWHHRDAKVWHRRWSEYLRTRHWRKLRLKVLKRHRYRCDRCGGVATQVHHLTYRHVPHEQRGDLVPTCERCHPLLDAQRDSLHKGGDHG